MANRFEDNAFREICSEKTLQSNSKGFFLNFADFVAQKTGDAWIKGVFGKLNNDGYRLKTVYNSKETKDLIAAFLSNVKEVYRPKNAEFSQKKRLEAETFFQQNDSQKALVIFCQSVLRAPKTDDNFKIDSGLSLALALWGRSKVLIKLNKHSLALSDIQLAFKEKLPESFRAQAFWKMGVCYKALNEENKAKVSFDLAEKLLANDCEKLQTLKEDEHYEGKTIAKKKMLKPKINGGPCENLPNASPKLSVKKSDALGRFVVANQKIFPGETLVVEPAYAACLLPERFGTHCHHCFTSLEAPTGCPDCSSVAFCNTTCRDKAVSTYHKYECKILDLLIGSGMSILAHTALRMVSQNDLDKCLEIYRNRDKEKIYSLCTNSHLRPPGDFLQRTLMAAFLLRCLQKSNYFGKERSNPGYSGFQQGVAVDMYTRGQIKAVPTENEFRIAEMLLFNLQILQFNAHEIYETRYSPKNEITAPKTLYLGVAIYVSASLFNHDCFPAVTRHFVGKDIVLTASRPLEPNDIVPENYGPVFTRKTLAERQRSLSSRYWFQCKCLACIQNWPTVKSGLADVSERLRCPGKQCSQFFTLPITKERVECNKCKHILNVPNITLLLKWCREQYHLAFEIMKTRDSQDIKKAVDILTVAIETFYRISLPPHKETQLAEEMVGFCLADSGNTSQPIL